MDHLLETKLSIKQKLPKIGVCELQLQEKKECDRPVPHSLAGLGRDQRALHCNHISTTLHILLFRSLKLHLNDY